MGLSDIVRSALVTIDTVTEDLKETVYLYRWNGQDDVAAPEYASRLKLRAIVHHKGKRTRTEAGEDVTRNDTLVIFTKPIPELAQADDDREKKPIDLRDKIVFANGETGPIIKTDGGLADPITGGGYVLQVWIG